MSNFNFKPTVLASAVATAMLTAGMPVDTVSAASHSNSKSQKPSLKISGQVNRAILYMDNEEQTDVQYVDNSASGTRFRLTGDTKLDVGGLTVGFVIENQYQDNPSNGQDLKDSDNNGNFKTRRQQIWVKGGWGKVGLGQSQGAADGTTEVDFSGTSMASYAFPDAAGGATFRNDGNPLIRPTAVSSALNSFDHNSRYDNLRYDTPSLGPVTLAVSAGNDKYDAAARMSTSWKGAKIAAALGYSTNQEGTNDFDTVGGSASVLLSFGTSITGMYTKRDFDNVGSPGDPDPLAGDDPDVWYVKLGQKFGNHSLSIDYGVGEDQAVDGDEATRYGLAYNYDFPKNKVQIYAGVAQFQLDRDVENPDDVTTVIVGSRIKF